MRDTHPLEDLLPPDVLQAGVEILDARMDVLELSLIGALDLARLADGEVKRKADTAVGLLAAQPALAAAVGRRREAHAVLTCLGCAEGEAA